MAYADILTHIKQVAESHIFINQVSSGDVYEEWNSGENLYPAINISPNSVNINGHSISYVNFTMTYADRLKQDESNKDLVQSNAIQVLTQILQKVEEQGYTIGADYEITLYTQRFADLLAGGFAEVVLYINYPIDEGCVDEDYFNK